MCKKIEPVKNVYLNKRNIYLTLGSLVFILLGIVAHDNAIEHSFFWGKLFPLFLSEVGIAGIIAVAIIVTIEQQSKEMERKDNESRLDMLGENVLKAVYKKNIQDSVFAVIEDCVLKANVCREKFRTNYTLTPINKDKDAAIDDYEHVTCTIVTTYDIINVTNKQIDHVITMVYECPYDKNWDDEVQVSSLVISNNDGEIDHTKDVKREIKKGQIFFTKEVQLKPHERIGIKSISNTIKRREDGDTLSSILPSDGVELRVTTPNSDLEVFAAAKHHKKLVYVGDGSVNWEWELKSGIFPYQSIIFWWKPKNKDKKQEDA